MPKTALVWFRSDLRLADNPALTAAIATGVPVIGLYIEETDPDLRPLGGASRWWLHHSLQSLQHDLAALGIPLELRHGPAEATVASAVQTHSASAVFWNRRYAPAQREHDAAIKATLQREGIEVSSFGANVLVEPWDIATGAGGPYGVYTPFWNALRQKDISRPLPAPAPTGKPVTITEPIDAAYRLPHWAEKLGAHWQIGEAAAFAKLRAFLDGPLGDYPEGRDFPARDVTSRLSPHLAFGEISPRQLWHAAQVQNQRAPATAGPVEKFLKELTWRDFNYHQLYHRPNIAREPMQARFAGLPWRDPGDALSAWQKGQTGIPIVDAGMRELWETGYMHNRVRMLTASLLAKNLLVDWRLGEAWFWDCLLDADPANNPGNWQWVAGSGLDAAPYFRIFNPVTQSNRFDAAGAYIRQWVPELARLPDDLIHDPAAAPGFVLRDAGITLGKTYPEPIVDLKTSRERALAAFKSL